MFENPYFLWLRRVELSIWNQEFLLAFSRSDVNTCALLQRGYIVYREWDKFWRQSGYWLSLKLDSQIFLYISSLTKNSGPHWHLCLTKKTPKQNKNTQTNQKPKQTPGLTRLSTVRGYRILLFILPRGNSAPWVQLGPMGPVWPTITRGHGWLEVLLVSGQYHKH